MLNGLKCIINYNGTSNVSEMTTKNILLYNEIC